MYDRVNKWGGAERVLLALHKIFPKAPLYTSVYNAKKAHWARVFRIYTSFLQSVPLAKSYHQLFSSFMPIAFRSFTFDNYDVVISVTSESAKAIHVKKNTLHICLCLTPTRYLWSGYADYFPNRLMQILSFPLIYLLRVLDKKAAKNPTKLIAISHEVKKRIKKYYERESEVIYPPLMIGPSKKIITFESKYSTVKKNHTYHNASRTCPRDYFLVVSRLSRFTQYKRIDIAIKAATKLKTPLIIIGQGNQKYFKKYAGPTVQFIDSVSDKELLEYYKYAKALIFPGKEDFGLVMVEAQLAGTPVIAYRAGGALEIVQEGKTGVFFKSQTVASLIPVLKTFDKSQYNSQSCKENAQRFSFSYFEKTIKQYILKAIKENSQ